jgi:hypothetical protein
MKRIENQHLECCFWSASATPPGRRAKLVDEVLKETVYSLESDVISLFGHLQLSQLGINEVQQVKIELRFFCDNQSSLHVGSKHVELKQFYSTSAKNNKMLLRTFF